MNQSDFFKQRLVLENHLVRLEPLEEKHFDLLLPVALQKKLWQFTTVKIISPEDFKRYFDTALQERQLKKAYPFAYFNKITQQYTGSTRYGNIDLDNKKLEIGWTWIHPDLHGTGFNKHAKYLLLSYGFEQLMLNRIELKTSLLNLQSQKAMLKIGAVREGVFRNHLINEDGTIRHSVYFSFIKEDWPLIKQTIFKEFVL